MDYELDDRGVAHVRIVSKTMTERFFDDVNRVFSALHAASTRIKVVLITSTNSSFTYGLDLKYAMSVFGANEPPAADELHAFIDRLQSYFELISSIKCPVITCIDGWCIGGGIDLVCCADIRMATRSAKFSVREIRLGIVADLGTLARLERLMSANRNLARLMAFTGCDVDATRVSEAGFVLAPLYADAATMHNDALRIANEIISLNSLSVRGVKQVMNHAKDHSECESLEYVRLFNSAFLPLTARL